MKHFFDIGANIGQTFDDYLCPDPQYDGWTIWCFEPSPRHLTRLIWRAEMERTRYNIKICPFGLWDSTQVLHLFEKDDPRGDSFEEITGVTETENRSPNLIRGYEILVPVMSISEFIRRHTSHDDEVTISIDAEGAEYPILANLVAPHFFKRIKKIMVEWHSCLAAVAYGGGDKFKSRFQELGLPLDEWMF